MVEQVVLGDLLVMHRPGWPTPVCGTGGEHRWEFTAPSLFCMECGAEVAAGDYAAVTAWWRYLAERLAPPLWN
jgi:hypothetical protein